MDVAEAVFADTFRLAGLTDKLDGRPIPMLDAPDGTRAVDATEPKDGIGERERGWSCGASKDEPLFDVCPKEMTRALGRMFAFAFAFAAAAATAWRSSKD